MIGYFNAKKQSEDKYLLTNDMGFYKYVNSETYDKLCNNKIEKGFIVNISIEEYIKKYSGFIRSMKSYCMGGTSLHIFAVTNMCNLDCIYCQAHSRNSHLDGKMTEEIGKRAIDIAMNSKNDNLTFEFQGGEPLLNFNVIKSMIEYSKEKIKF